MITFRPDQVIFESKSQVITNTVNCHGVMGKGIALEFKSRFPKMFDDYRLRCEREEVKPGVPYLWEDDGLMILNFPSKNHWKGNSKIEWIEQGFSWIRENYERLGISTLAMPPVGCGNGGLYWSDVKVLVEKYFGDLDDLLVTVYLPRQSVAGVQKKPISKGKTAAGRVPIIAAAK